MWDRLIGLCSNLVFVFSGHVLNNGTGCLISEDVHGNRVCQMMANCLLYTSDAADDKGGGEELFALYGYFSDGAGSPVRRRRA